MNKIFEIVKNYGGKEVIIEDTNGNVIKGKFTTWNYEDDVEDFVIDIDQEYNSYISIPISTIKTISIVE